MAKIRIYEIANEAGYSSKEILEKVKELGLDIKSASSAVEEEIAGAIYEYIQSGKIPEVFQKNSKSNSAKKSTKTPKKDKEDKKEEKTKTKKNQNSKNTQSKTEKESKKIKTLKNNQRNKKRRK